MLQNRFDSTCGRYFCSCYKFAKRRICGHTVLVEVDRGLRPARYLSFKSNHTDAGGKLKALKTSTLFGMKAEPTPHDLGLKKEGNKVLPTPVNVTEQMLKARGKAKAFPV